ncbi:MAG: hypothetical protein FH762_20140 [Firmicutes bacterium]|nr:hypothetical protein [Bacillota bacterium]
MKLPEKVKIGGINYEVLLVPLKSEELNYGDAIGSIIHSECKIWINKEMPLQKQQETLLHEIIHAYVCHLVCAFCKDQQVQPFCHL